MTQIRLQKRNRLDCIVHTLIHECVVLTSTSSLVSGPMAGEYRRLPPASADCVLGPNNPACTSLF